MNNYYPIERQLHEFSKGIGIGRASLDAGNKFVADVELVPQFLNEIEALSTNMRGVLQTEDVGFISFRETDVRCWREWQRNSESRRAIGRPSSIQLNGRWCP